MGHTNTGICPTEDSGEGLKDSFYDSLEEMIARTLKNDQLVVM